MKYLMILFISLVCSLCYSQDFYIQGKNVKDLEIKYVVAYYDVLNLSFEYQWKLDTGKGVNIKDQIIKDLNGNKLSLSIAGVMNGMDNCGYDVMEIEGTSIYFVKRKE